MDEMSQIYEISIQKIDFLEKLRENYKVPELNERIDWAVRKIKEDNENLPRLINDLKASLDVVSISSPDKQPIF